MLKRITPERFNQFLIIKRSTRYAAFLDETLCDCEIYEMTEDEEQPKEEKKPQEKPKQAPKKKEATVDLGKVKALYEGGKSIEWIADDMHFSKGYIYQVVRELIKNGTITKRKEATDGGDA